MANPPCGKPMASSSCDCSMVSRGFIYRPVVKRSLTPANATRTAVKVSHTAGKAARTAVNAARTAVNAARTAVNVSHTAPDSIRKLH